VTTIDSDSTEFPEPASHRTIFSMRPATVVDGEGILACLRAAFDEYAAEYTEGAFAATVLTRESLHDRLRTMTVWVAVTTHDRIVGTLTAAITDHAEGHLRGMAVHPEFQQRGIAASLLKAALADLQRRGCNRVTLNTTDPLRTAVTFYESHGFRPTGRVSPFFGMTLREYAREI